MLNFKYLVQLLLSNIIVLEIGPKFVITTSFFN